MSYRSRLHEKRRPKEGGLGQLMAITLLLGLAAAIGIAQNVQPAKETSTNSYGVTEMDTLETQLRFVNISGTYRHVNGGLCLVSRSPRPGCLVISTRGGCDITFEPVRSEFFPKDRALGRRYRSTHAVGGLTLFLNAVVNEEAVALFLQAGDEPSRDLAVRGR